MSPYLATLYFSFAENPNEVIEVSTLSGHEKGMSKESNDLESMAADEGVLEESENVEYLEDVEIAILAKIQSELKTKQISKSQINQDWRSAVRCRETNNDRICNYPEKKVEDDQEKWLHYTHYISVGELLKIMCYLRS